MSMLSRKNLGEAAESAHNTRRLAKLEARGEAGGEVAAIGCKSGRTGDQSAGRKLKGTRRRRQREKRRRGLRCAAAVKREGAVSLSRLDVEAETRNTLHRVAHLKHNKIKVRSEST